MRLKGLVTATLMAVLLCTSVLATSMPSVIEKEKAWEWRSYKPVVSKEPKESSLTEQCRITEYTLRGLNGWRGKAQCSERKYMVTSKQKLRIGQKVTLKTNAKGEIQGINTC